VAYWKNLLLHSRPWPWVCGLGLACLWPCIRKVASPHEANTVDQCTFTRKTRHFAFACMPVMCFDCQYARRCSHSNETRAPIANPPNSAQLGSTHYNSPKLHPGPCSSVGMRRGRDTQTYTHTRVTTIHFPSSTTHAKCKKNKIFWLTKFLISANVWTCWDNSRFRPFYYIHQAQV